MTRNEGTREGRARRAIAAAVVVLISLGASVHATDDLALEYRKVALTGEQAPGLQPGAVFSIFTTGLNHSIMRPQIDEDGRIAFIGLVEGAGVDETNRSGIWSEQDGQLGLVVRTGMSAPGGPPGAVFSGVPSEYLPFPPSVGDGLALFQGVITGPGVTTTNDEGLWIGRPGELTLLAREGDAAPGLLDVTFGLLGGIVDREGRASITANLTGQGVSASSNDSIWTNRAGTLELLVREGNPATDVGPGVVFGAGNIGVAYPFLVKDFNEDARMLVQANVMGADIDSFNDETVMLEDPELGRLVLVARDGDPVPSVAPDATFGGGSVQAFFRNLKHNQQGDIVFTARVGGPNWSETVMFSNRTGELDWIARSGQPAPGTSSNFTLLGGPFLNGAGHVVFSASVETGQWPPLGIFWDRPGALEAVVLPGEPIGDFTLTGASQIVGFSDDGDLAFRVGLEDVHGDPRSGLILGDGAGNLHVVAVIGDSFDVQGDGSDLREILRLEAGGLSENGVVAFRLDFTDGSSGHFAASIRRPGAAGSLAVARVGGALELSWSGDCTGQSDGFGVYRGDLTQGYDSVAQEPGRCSVEGNSTVIPEGPGSADFFLVVPNMVGVEGDYGYGRAASSDACYPQGQPVSCGPDD